VTETLKAALKFCLAPALRRAAAGYVAGPEMDDALLACRTLRERGRAASVGYWNFRGEQPGQVFQTYLAAVEALSLSGLDACLSIKATALRFSPKLIAELLERTGPAGIPVHFDSLTPESVHPTMALAADAASRQSGLGITLPSRWRRSLGDADAAAELGLSVRLVKGRWADRASEEVHMRAGFLALVDRLAGRASRVAVATHDTALARAALRRLRAAGTPCELELLLGLPAGPAASAADQLLAPVRVYVPYGDATLPYRIQDVRRDARILGWLSQDLLRGKHKGKRELSHRLDPGAMRLGLANATPATRSSGSRHARV
jgi:proline dehydrogenase